MLQYLVDGNKTKLRNRARQRRWISLYFLVFCKWKSKFLNILSTLTIFLIDYIFIEQNQGKIFLFTLHIFVPWATLKIKVYSLRKLITASRECSVLTGRRTDKNLIVAYLLKHLKSKPRKSTYFSQNGIRSQSNYEIRRLITLCCTTKMPS